MTELGTFITLSTAHLEQDVSEMLTAHGAGTREPSGEDDYLAWLTVCDYAYGHWVRVHRPASDAPEDIAEHRAKMAQLPECLADCMRVASQYASRWILFDQDAAELGTLRIYNW